MKKKGINALANEKKQAKAKPAKKMNVKPPSKKMY